MIDRFQVGFNVLITITFRAVEILKACAATDSISLWVSRDSESLSDFHRLSNSLIAKDGHPQGKH